MVKQKENQIKGETKEVSKKEKEDKQLFWTLIIVGVVIIGFLGTYFYVQSLKTFDYAGEKWVKEKLGNLKFYNTRFHVFYDANAFYNLQLREDPRENKIPINATFKFWERVIVSTEPEASRCEDGIIANGNLMMFLGQALNIKTKPAFTDEKIAEEQNTLFANCSDSYPTARETVIIIQKSETPSIEKISEHCYAINIGDCKSIESVERFIIGILAQLNDVGV